MRLRRARWLFVASLASSAWMLGAGCSDDYGADSPSGSDDAGASSDAASGDDAPADGSGDASADAPATFDAHAPVDGAIIDDSFEDGAGCAGWTTFGLPVAPAPPGHTGLRSCKLCPTEPIQFIARTAAMPSDAGGTADLVVRVRAAEGSAAAGALGMLLFFRGEDGGSLATHYTNGPVTSDWTAVQMSRLIPAGTTQAGVNIQTEDAGPPGCVIIDDVLLTVD